MDYETIQRIAAGVVDSSSACDGQLFEGTVTSAEPLKISLGEGGIELDGDDIILTQSVVKKLLYIKTHTHKIGSDLQTHTHPFVGAFSGTISGNPASESLTSDYFLFSMKHNPGSSSGDRRWSKMLASDPLLLGGRLPPHLVRNPGPQGKP